MRLRTLAACMTLTSPAAAFAAFAAFPESQDSSEPATLASAEFAAEPEPSQPQPEPAI